MKQSPANCLYCSPVTRANSEKTVATAGLISNASPVLILKPQNKPQALPVPFMLHGVQERNPKLCSCSYLLVTS